MPALLRSLTRRCRLLASWRRHGCCQGCTHQQFHVDQHGFQELGTTSENGRRQGVETDLRTLVLGVEGIAHLHPLLLGLRVQMRCSSTNTRGQPQQYEPATPPAMLMLTLQLWDTPADPEPVTYHLNRLGVIRCAGPVHGPCQRVSPLGPLRLGPRGARGAAPHDCAIPQRLTDPLPH